MEIVCCLTCPQMHYGLCVKKNAANYEAALKLAKALHTHFCKDHQGNFHALKGYAVAQD